MKIAILSPIGRSGNPEHGGIETVVKNLAEEFVRQGHTVDLLVYPKRGQEPSIGVISAAINIVRLDAQHKRTLVRPLVRYSHENQPDILLAASHRANMAACWAKSRLFAKTRVFVSEHSTVSEAVKTYSQLKQWRRFHLMRTGYPHADGIIAVSEGVAKEIRCRVGVDAARTKVIYNPIVTPDMTTLGEQPVTHSWFAGDPTPVILGVGRLVVEKDFPTLLRAFAQVRAKRPCRLIILGKGPERCRLQTMARTLRVERDVDLPGFIPNPLPYMRRAAILAMSSAFEGFGNVLAEALAVGTPVVSTDCPHGPREILSDGLYGPLVPVGDVDALAQGIESVLDALPQPERLRARAVAFSTATIAEQYLATFRSPVGPQRS